MRRSLAAGLSVSMALALTAACDKQPKECAALIAVIDDDDHPIAELGAAGSGVARAAALSDLSKRLAALEDKLAADLAALPLTVQGLKTLSGAYQSFARECAASARESADVMDRVAVYEPKVDPARPDGVPQRTKSAIDKMTERCKTRRSKECVKLYDGMKRVLPEAAPGAPPVDWATQAKHIDAFVADAGGTTFKDAELKKDFDEFIASMKGSSAVLHEAVDLRAKMDASKAKLDAVLAKQKPLTDGVNLFCMPQQQQQQDAASRRP
jgi:hypothetical protein